MGEPQKLLETPAVRLLTALAMTVLSFKILEWEAVEDPWLTCTSALVGLSVLLGWDWGLQVVKIGLGVFR